MLWSAIPGVSHSGWYGTTRLAGVRMDAEDVDLFDAFDLRIDGGQFTENLTVYFDMGGIRFAVTEGILAKFAFSLAHG